MLKRNLLNKISILLIISMLFTMLSAVLPIQAASTLSITSPDDGESISMDSKCKVQWNSYSGAGGYFIHAVMGVWTSSGFVSTEADNGDLMTNTYTTKTYYSIPATSKNCTVKIWVAAMDDTVTDEEIDDGICNGDRLLAQTTIYVLATEAPDVTTGASSAITTSGAKLTMTIDKNNGLEITDSGFYIGTSSTKSSMTKYSFLTYSTDQKAIGAVSNQTVTMTVTGLKSNTKYYYRAYAENAYGTSYAAAKNFTTEAEADDFSLSKTSLTFLWDSTSEKSIDVTCNGTYSISSVKYNVPSSVSDSAYNYQWLNVEKVGDEILFTPNRKNYASSSRSATVTVSYGSESKDITITQASCGETAPTMTLKRGTSSCQSGDTLGTFSLPQESFTIDIESNYVRTLYAKICDSNDDCKAQCSTALNTGVIAFDISSLSAGDYVIYIYTSNSDTANDYYKQTVYDNEPCVLYFSLVNGSGSGEASDDKDFTSFSNALKMIKLSKTLDWSDIGTIEYVEQYWSGGNDVYYYTGSNGYWTDDAEATGRCTRAAACMALSYMGLTALPKNVSPTSCPYADYAKTAFGCNTEGEDAETSGSNYSISMSTFKEWYSRYADDTTGSYSPIVIHTNKSGGIHAFTIFGRDANDNNYYYVVDSGTGDHVAKIKLVEVNGKITVGEYIKVNGSASTAYSSSYAVVGVWQYTKKSTTECVHTNKTSVSAVKSTCKVQGNDAYYICDDCGQIFASDGTTKLSAIPYRALGSHTGGTATCTEQAVCSVCGTKYGTTNTSNHIHTEIRNVQTATCSTNGYTGDTYCTDCGVKVKSGTTITATGEHIDANGEWETDGTNHWHTCGCGTKFDVTAHSGGTATCSEQAVCSVCHQHYGNLGSHVYNAQIKNSTTLKTAATTTTEAVYYYSCSVCSACEHNDTHTFLGEKLDDENTVRIVVENKKEQIGKEFTVTVEVKDNPGFSVLTMTPIYSEELTLVSVENGELISNFVQGNQYVWTSFDGDVATNGKLITFTFTTQADVKSGEYEVGFAYSVCSNYDEKSVSVSVEKGTITLFDFVYGDANGDGVVTVTDIVRLIKYFANYDYTTNTSTIEIGSGADANGDGNVTVTDIVRLIKYFANYDYTTNTSTIILGPQT